MLDNSKCSSGSGKLPNINMVIPKLHSYPFGPLLAKAGIKVSSEEQVSLCTLGPNTLKFFIQALFAAQDAKEDPLVRPTRKQLLALQCLSSGSSDLVDEANQSLQARTFAGPNSHLTRAPSNVGQHVSLLRSR